MKRLFKVDGEFFDNKVKAKAARGKPDADGNFKHKISRGPDHIGVHGQTFSKADRRGPQDMQPRREGPRKRTPASVLYGK